MTTTKPLVSKLRDWPVRRETAIEAAHEIERLRRLERLYQPGGYRPDYPSDGFINDYD